MVSRTGLSVLMFTLVSALVLPITGCAVLEEYLTNRLTDRVLPIVAKTVESRLQEQVPGADKNGDGTLSDEELWEVVKDVAAKDIEAVARGDEIDLKHDISVVLMAVFLSIFGPKGARGGIVALKKAAAALAKDGQD